MDRLGRCTDMLAALKLVLIAFSLGGLAVAGAAATDQHMPLENAKLNLQEKLGQNSTMPEQSKAGLENAYEHVCANQARWLENHNMTKPAHGNETGLEPDE